MSYLVGFFIVIGVFLFMEFVAWFTHRYIMHGFLWSWHRSHHRYRKGLLERNDLFFIVFALPAIATFYFGLQGGLNYLFFVGMGITAYGIFYILFHDILVHQRVPFRLKVKSTYLKRMIKAHYVHHAKHEKEGCEAFGFLWAPKKYAEDKKKEPEGSVN